MSRNITHAALKAAVSSLAAVTLAFTSCYSWFENKGLYGGDSGSTSMGDLLEETQKITKLDTPAQVIVSKGLYSDRISITWQPVDYAKSYRIERAVSMPGSDGTYTIPDEGDYSVLKEFVYDKVYSDTILKAPSASSEEYTYRYYYRICAENIGKGLEASEYTDPSGASTDGCGWLLEPPSNVQAWKGKSTSRIEISWTGVEDAVSYEIYRGEKENGGGMELIGSVRGNSTLYANEILTAEQGLEFYYRVLAKNSYDQPSALSNVAMGYTLREGAPATPESVTVENGMGVISTKDGAPAGLSVRWSPVSAADGTTLTYSLYRTSSQDSAYTLVKSGITGTSYTDSGSLKTGIYYYYYVQAVATTEGVSLKGSFSESGPDSANPALGFLLSPPDYVEAQDGKSKDTLNLVWLPAPGEELGLELTYNIYTASSQDGTYTPVESGIPGTKNSGGYIEHTVNKAPYFKISSVNSNGTESVLSAAAAPMPAAPTNVTASKTAYVDGYMSDSNANTLGVYPVKVTWKSPADDNPAGYYVYRSTSRDSQFRKLNNEPVTGLEYVDENASAKAGTYYYYKVVSVNSLGQGNKGNDPGTDKDNASRGYGAITREQWFREYNKTIMSSQKKLTLMHNPDDMKKLGSEEVKGTISGTLGYTAKVAGLGAEITMPYTNYADFYTGGDPALGVYFALTGNTDTTSNMSANGNMHGTVECTGMYPGYAIYDNLQIKGGAAGGGYYKVLTRDLSGKTVLAEANVDWTVGEER